MPNDETVKTGVNLPRRTVDRMDERKRHWDRLEARNISRSDVAREVIPLGLTALELIEEEYGRGLTTKDRESLLRQALHEYIERDRASNDASDA